MATLTTNSKGASIDLRKFAPPCSATPPADLLRADLGTVTQALTGSCTAGATLTSSAVTFAAPQTIRIAGWTTAPGTLRIETSSDAGTTWPNADQEAIPAGEYVLGIAVPVGGANRYRLKFTAGNVAASRVEFHTQART